MNIFLLRKHLSTWAKAVASALPGETPSIFLRIHRTKKGTPSTTYEMHLAGPDTLREEMIVDGKVFSFHISPSSFFQPNPKQAEKLFFPSFLLLQNFARKTACMTFYCGAAVAGILCAPKVRRVVGIESNPYATCDATQNIAANRAANVSVIRGDVGKILSAFQLPPDLALLDPPRSGLEKNALEELIRLKPPRILYLSCQPTSQKRDLEHFVQAGYALVAIQPVDQFPHTPHLENIAYLKRLAV